MVRGKPCEEGLERGWKGRASQEAASGETGLISAPQFSCLRGGSGHGRPAADAPGPAGRLSLCRRPHGGPGGPSSRPYAQSSFPKARAPSLLNPPASLTSSVPHSASPPASQPSGAAPVTSSLVGLCFTHIIFASSTHLRVKIPYGWRRG